MPRYKIRYTLAGRLLIAAIAGTLSGCDRAIMSVMVDAPNRGRSARSTDPSAAPPLPRWLGATEQFYVDVGPPDAKLRVWRFEPKDDADLIDGNPKGTILVIHGYRNTAFWMLINRRALARAGYRLFFVDLRGHGKSTGDYISYGAVESQDLVQVIDELQRRDLITGRIGVWGHSMGAATAIQLAARDPRVEAVVAVSPYTTMRDVVPHLVHKALPFSRSFIEPEKIDQLVDQAGERAGFDPDQASTLHAIQQTDTPILIMHGQWDWVVPYEHGKKLHEAAPDHTEFITLPKIGHVLADVVRHEGFRPAPLFIANLEGLMIS